MKHSIVVALVALVAPLAGCQIAMSTLRAKAGLSEPAHPVEQAPAPQTAAAESTADEGAPTGTSDTSDTSVADDSGTREEYAQPVAAATPEPPRCTAPGRPEMCDGQCVDVQVDANYCGACFNHCHSGDHCDYGQCRDAEGKPD